MATVVEKLSKAKLDLAVYKHTNDTVDEPYTSMDYQLSQIDRENVHELFDDELRRRERFVEYMDDGHVGMVIHDGTEWMSRGWTVTPESTAAPRALPDEICSNDWYWLFDAETNPDYRGHGLFKEINRVRTKWVYDRDPNAEVYTDTGVDNVARYGIESSGFEPRGLITLIRIEIPGGDLWKWSRWNRDAPHPEHPE